jgi:hypothetical protein
VGLLPIARAVDAQPAVLRRLNFDRLQLAALGASAGPIRVSQTKPTTVYALGADYGEITRDWRVIFGVSYWGSRYTDAVVQTFVDSLNSFAAAAGASRVQPSMISLYDVTFGMEFRWMPTYSGEIKPFVGIGLAGHVIDAEGKLINGTVVERALDNIAAGLIGSTGAQLRLLRHFGVEATVRADLLSGFRSLQARAGGYYVFGRLRNPST